MTTWHHIKTQCTKGSTPRTVRYLNQVNLANDVYMAIRNKLKDLKQADDAFNADTDVTEAICARRQLEDMAKHF